MLHFLIGIALCIWIAERIAHYWMGWRENRELTRALKKPRRRQSHLAGCFPPA